MGKFPEIGEMVERMTVRRPVKIDDEYHGKRLTWLGVAEVWGSFEPISSREYFFGQANQAEVTHKIKIRYRPDIGQGWQIKHRDAYYSVQSAIDIAGRRRFLELLCIEAKEGGE
jgi:SPP1 family predicted phage head-tail adaptor